MVVDGSKLVRKLIGDVLLRELPGTEVIGCASIAEARERWPKARSTWSPPRWSCPTAMAWPLRAACARRRGRPTCR
jgi:hypothetical protein